jgi:hypothetical protein
MRDDKNIEYIVSKYDCVWKDTEYAMQKVSICRPASLNKLDNSAQLLKAKISWSVWDLGSNQMVILRLPFFSDYLCTSFTRVLLVGPLIVWCGEKRKGSAKLARS